MLPIDRRHLVLEQDLHAGLSGRGLQRPHQAVAGGKRRLDGRIGRLAGLHHRPVHDGACISRGTELPTEVPAERVGRLVDEDDAMRDEPFEGRRAVVGKGADDLAVVVAVIGKAVGLDHRPVGQVAEEQIRRIVDAVFLLRAGAAAERDIAAAGDGVAADVLFGLDQDDRRAGFARDDRRGKPGRA